MLLFGIFLNILGLLIIAFGIFSIRKPTFGWSWSEGWKVKGDSEPSGAYIGSIKFGGAISIILGSLLLIGGILNLLC
ncbi:hypothetical protein J2Z22_001981 [Paenibacillus forsythiae]|uniref:DUF6199 domain-containing protein n=1 Tax=Paenibacillus forsythiae TaxID=365616 RepID=A0ABU3H6U3_9BACL|nr:DUF6199 family natural product biosynthesis protein [Paenibacillus forsythiae]MDT3426455.1 hypothetical protein [Paenibacillus forsythiae]